MTLWLKTTYLIFVPGQPHFSPQWTGSKIVSETGQETGFGTSSDNVAETSS